MPKESSERIIDWPYSAPSSRGGSTSIGTGGGGGGGGAATNLDALTDVTISGLANGQVLSYNAGSGQWVNSANAQSVPNPHGLSSGFHNGTLNWPLINFSGSDMADLALHRHVDLQGMTPNDHHSQLHVLATGTALGPDHSISGAAVGEVLRALGPTTAAFDVLQHTDLGNILPNQHHFQVHDILGTDHTVVGADFTVVGVHPINTIALLPTSSAPGAAVSILKTDSNGGIQLDTNVLYVDGANNWVGVNRTPSGAALDIIASSTGDITQRIRQITGQTQRLWRVEDTSGNELIVMDSVGNLQSGSPGYVSGLTGWQISPGGNAEFNNIWARGELHATVFVKDEVHATGGTLLVATAGVLYDDANIDSTAVDDDALYVNSTPAGHGVPLQIQSTSASFTGTELRVSFIGNVLNVNDPPSGAGFYFQPGEIIRSKTEVATGVTDFWFVVNAATQNSGYSSYSVTKMSGTDGRLPKGSALVSYGQQGDGRILMTSDWRSDMGYTPYIDVFTTGAAPWDANDPTAIIPRMRMGQLSGVGAPGTNIAGVSGISQWGMIAGTNLSDANSGYFIASNVQFALYKINIRLNNGTTDTGLWTANGDLKIGKNVGAAATTGFQFDSNSGNVVIGDTTKGHFIRWDQTNGIMTVQGNLIVQDPGTTVTLQQVTDADNAVRQDAQGYASTAQTNAQNYGDAHRIIATGAIFTSASATTIAWASFTVQMAANVTRTIAAGSATVSARSYLYVNVGLTGTLTMTPTTSITSITQLGYLLIAVADPGTTGISGSNAATVTVVVGSTYISGSNVFTRSIMADRLVANSISTSELTVGVNNSITTANTNASQALSDAADAATAATNAQTYGEARRIVGVSGSWYSAGPNQITWGTTATATGTGGTALSVVFASPAGSSRAIANGSTGTMSLRTYLYINIGLAGTLTMATTTNAALINQAGYVLIAVCDPGAQKASVSVVAGSTYISGGNIFTQSITAGNIAVGTIDATLIDSSVYVSGAGGYRVAAVSDGFSIAGKVVSWTSLVIVMGDGTNLTVTNGSFDTTNRTPGALIYLYIGGAATSPTTLTPQTVLSALPAGAVIIAVIEAGVTFATYRVVNGGTIIAGDQIVTNSIVTANLAAGAVTAAKITVDGNVNIQNGGSLIVASTGPGAPGSIHSSGKSYGIGGGTGYFLGFSGATPVFSIGSSSSYIDWNGTSLVVAANSLAVSSASASNIIGLGAPGLSATIGLLTNSLQGSGAAVTFSTAVEVPNSVKATRFSATASIDTPVLTTPHLTLNDPNSGAPFVSNMLQFTRAGNTHYFGYAVDGTLSWDGDLSVNGSLIAQSLSTAANHINIATEKGGIGSSFSTPAGTVGDIAWAQGFIYVYTGSTNGWRRAVLNSF